MGKTVRGLHRRFSRLRAPDFERSSGDSGTAVAGRVAWCTSVRNAVEQDENGFKRAQISELEHFDGPKTSTNVEGISSLI